MHFGILDNYGLYKHPADACVSSHFVESAKIWVNDNTAGYANNLKSEFGKYKKDNGFLIGNT